MTESSLFERLSCKDTSLWTEDGDVSAAILKRLGWLDVLSTSTEARPMLEHFAQQIRAEGFDRAILLGMGGSSLAADVLRRCFGSDRGATDLLILDSTFPDSVTDATRFAEAAKCLFIVSSKSGTTAETSAMFKHFWQWAERLYGSSAGEYFVAITDEGSPLQALSQAKGFRQTFLAPADIGGRYSALSLFGLVPACLLGIDVERLLTGAAQILIDGPAADRAVDLGLFVGEAAKHGRDKLTLCLSGGLAPMGPWIDQLVSESTGKENTGVVCVLDDDLEVACYGDDRIFVGACLDTEKDWIDAWTHRQTLLENANHPHYLLRSGGIYDLGAEFATWQVAVSVAASVLRVNPFDEPDVNASKQLTREILQDTQPDSANADAVLPGATTLARFLGGVSAPAYVAVLAYLPDTGAWRDALEQLRRRIASNRNAAVTTAFGPRYLHSSGQLHKGGPEGGNFVVLTARADEDLPVPGEPYGFGHLIAAQALGDIAALRARQRRVLHVDLGSIGQALRTVELLE